MPEKIRVIVSGKVGVFHGWGMDSVEMNDGIVKFTAGIIEWEGGSITLEYAPDIKFVDKVNVTTEEKEIDFDIILAFDFVKIIHETCENMPHDDKTELSIKLARAAHMQDMSEAGNRGCLAGETLRNQFINKISKDGENDRRKSRAHNRNSNIRAQRYHSGKYRTNAGPGKRDPGTPRRKGAI